MRKIKSQIQCLLLFITALGILANELRRGKKRNAIWNMGVNVSFLAESGFILRKQENSLEKVKVRVASDSLWPHWLYSPWNSPGQNTGVGSLSLLHRIFPTQGLNSGLLHCRQILYQLSHKGSPIQKVKHLPKDENKGKMKYIWRSNAFHWTSYFLHEWMYSLSKILHLKS